jgi:hypothetical protein
LRVLAKTTGDAPEIILPDGRIRPVRRLGPPRIKEHIDILRQAARLQAGAVVAEGMALQPETVFASELILRATHAVITNVRPDHRETMGPGREGVCRTLGLMLPERGVLFTSRESGAEELQRMAAARGIDCVVVEGAELGQARDLAAAVCAGVQGGGDFAALPRNGSPSNEAAELRFAQLREHFQCENALAWNGLPVRHYDLFSANDVVSAGLLLQDGGFGRLENCLKIALLATRADRPLRTGEFLEWLGSVPLFDGIVPVGDHAAYVWLRGGKNVLRENPFIRPDRLLTRLCRAAKAGGRSGLTVAGLGNAHGYARRWRAFLAGMEDRHAG